MSRLNGYGDIVILDSHSRSSATIGSIRASSPSAMERDPGEQDGVVVPRRSPEPGSTDEVASFGS
jgi:hypothetical protein